MQRTPLLLVLALGATCAPRVFAQPAPTPPTTAEAAPTSPPTAPSSAPGAATANTSGAESNADQQYATAQEHYKARRYTEALRMFRQLTAEHRSPNARIYVGRCLREMGRLPEAHDELDRTMREAADRAETEPRFADTREAARQELAEVRSRVGLLDIRPTAWPAGLRVEVNGRSLPTHRLGTPVPVMPGRVTLFAAAPGFQPVRVERVVAANTTDVLTVELLPVGETRSTQPTPQADAPNRKSEPDEEEEEVGDGGTSGYVVGGITFVGLGVIGWITFGVAAAMAEERFEDIEDECNGVRCTDPSINDSIDEGRVMDIVANAGLGLGVIGFVTAGVLFAIEIASDDEQEPPVAPAADVGLRTWSTAAGNFVGVGGTF